MASINSNTDHPFSILEAAPSIEKIFKPKWSLFIFILVSSLKLIYLVIWNFTYNFTQRWDLKPKILIWIPRFQVGLTIKTLCFYITLTVWFRTIDQNKVSWKIVILKYFDNRPNFNVFPSLLDEFSNLRIHYQYLALVFFFVRSMPFVILTYVLDHAHNYDEAKWDKHYWLSTSNWYQRHYLKKGYDDVEYVRHLWKLKKQIFWQEVIHRILRRLDFICRLWILTDNS